MRKSIQYALLIVGFACLAVMGCKSAEVTDTTTTDVDKDSLLVVDSFPGLDEDLEEEPELLHPMMDLKFGNISTAFWEQNEILPGLPVTDLAAGTPLILHFDIPGVDVENLYFDVILCDFDWVRADLDPYDYIDGPLEGDVNSWRNSFNTAHPYVHYTVQLPNEDMRLLRAGNYVVRVFQRETQSLLLQRRFMVNWPGAAVTATVKRSSKPSLSRTHQEVDFEVSFPGIEVSNPYEEIRVVVMQNGRWDQAATDLEPSLAYENRLEYDYQDENSFPAGKDFRFFDVRDLRRITENISGIKEISDTTHVVLHVDPVRSYERYVYRKDFNGGFVVDNAEGTDPNHDANYVKVHFTLGMEYPLDRGELYVIGAMTDWQPTESGRMRFDFERKQFTTSMWLKQGYYNYMYGFFEAEGSNIDFGLVEGNHYETENDYQILVYYRPFGEWADQLIGVAQINSLD